MLLVLATCLLARVEVLSQALDLRGLPSDLILQQLDALLLLGDHRLELSLGRLALGLLRQPLFLGFEDSLGEALNVREHLVLLCGERTRVVANAVVVQAAADLLRVTLKVPVLFRDITK